MDHLTLGWLWISLGIGTGLVLGLKSEPFGLDPRRDNPEWLGGYASAPRRLIRLGHIAFIMLGLLNVAYAFTPCRLPADLQQAASRALAFGTIGVPLLCLAAARHRALKVLLGLPAAAVLVAALLTAWGTVR